MISKVSKSDARKVRHERVRDKVFGTSDCPRLCVYRSNTNIYAQIINDEEGKTLVSASSLDKELNLKNNLIYIDKSELNKEFLNKLNTKYNINIDKSKLPMLIFMLDRQIVKIIYIEPNFNIDIIDFGVFE